jgi:diguanylate cyclase (GGDEF)-like protein
MFDGRRFTNIRKVAGHESRDILSIDTDHDNKIWLVVQVDDRKIAFLQYTHGRFVEFYRTDYLITTGSDADYNNKLSFAIASNQNKNSLYFIDSDKQLNWVLGNSDIVFSDPDLPTSIEQIAIINKQLIVAGYDDIDTGKICLFKIESTSVKEQDCQITPYSNDISFQIVEENNKHNIYLISHKYLGHFELTHENARRLHKKKSWTVDGLIGSRFFVDNHNRNRLIFGSDNSVFELELNSDKPIKISQYLPYDVGNFNGVLSDVEGNIWVYTSQELIRINPRQLAYANRRSGLVEDEVSTIKKHPSGVIFLGHNVGISLIKEDTIIPIPFTPIPNEMLRVMDVIAVDNGFIFTAHSRGLGFVDLNGVVSFSNFVNQDLIHDAFSIAKNDSEIFVGASNGVFRLSEGIISQILGDDTGRQFTRRVKIIDRQLYVAHVQGLGVFENGQWRWPLKYQNAYSLRDVAYDFIKLSSEKFLLARNDGLWILEDGVLSRPINKLSQLNDIAIYSIYKEDNQLWFGTNNGLYRLDGELTHYSARTGLPSNETNRAALTRINGRLVIGTTSGLAQIIEDGYERPNATGGLSFTGLQINGERTLPENLAQLTSEQRNIILTFDSVSLLRYNNFEFRYRLEPDGDAWKPVQLIGQAVIHLNDLTPGDKEFKIQSLSGGRIVDEISLPFTVQQPLYRSDAITYLLVIFFVSVSSVVFFKLRQYRFHANYDETTRLLNRRKLVELINEEMANTGRGDLHYFSVIYINIIGLKNITEQFGVAVSEQALYDLGQRIKKVVSSKEVIGRMSNNEFVVLVQKTQGARTLRQLGSDILERLNRPLDIKQLTVSLSSLIGYATYNNGIADAEQLIALAERDMLKSKVKSVTDRVNQESLN